MIRQPGSRHWLLAITLAIAVHALAMVRLDSGAQPVHRADDPGAQAITIALAPPPVAAPSEPAPRAEPEPESQPEPEPVESPVKTPEPEEEPQPEPEPEPEPEPKEPEVTEEPEAEPRQESAPTEADNPSDDNATQESSDQLAAQTADHRQAGASGGIQDAPPDYRAEVSAWLERHKEYPMSARRKAEQGMAMVSFTFDRDGNILEYKLLRPTGHISLDQAVEEMLERADPLPKMPNHLAHQRMTWTLPVYFRLN